MRLKPYAKNARIHSDDQVAKIAASLVEYGWTAPVMVADDGEIVAGHGRLLAAQHLGLDQVPIIRLSHLTPEQVRAELLARVGRTTEAVAELDVAVSRCGNDVERGHLRDRRASLAR